MDGADDFLGRGWAFPITSGADGEVTLVAAAEDVRQAILLILQTEPGERVMRPDFGCGLRGQLFEPVSVRTLSALRRLVEDGLTAWEPRIDLQEVSVEADPDDPARVLIDIAYRIRSTNAAYNLVYPFYLQEARQ